MAYGAGVFDDVIIQYEVQANNGTNISQIGLDFNGSIFGFAIAQVVETVKDEFGKIVGQLTVSCSNFGCDLQDPRVRARRYSPERRLFSPVRHQGHLCGGVPRLCVDQLRRPDLHGSRARLSRHARRGPDRTGLHPPPPGSLTDASRAAAQPRPCTLSLPAPHLVQAVRPGGDRSPRV